MKSFTKYLDEGSLSPAKKARREASRDRGGSKESIVKKKGWFKKEIKDRGLRPEKTASKSERRAHNRNVGKGINARDRDPNMVGPHVRSDADATIKNKQLRQNIANMIKSRKALKLGLKTGDTGFERKLLKKDIESGKEKLRKSYKYKKD